MLIRLHRMLTYSDAQVGERGLTLRYCRLMDGSTDQIVF